MRRDDGGFGKALASAGPHANNLHLAFFLQADAHHGAQPIKALKA